MAKTSKVQTGMKLVLTELEKSPDNSMSKDSIKEFLYDRNFTRHDLKNILLRLTELNQITVDEDTKIICKIGDYETPQYSNRFSNDIRLCIKDYFLSQFQDEIIDEKLDVSISLDDLMNFGTKEVIKRYYPTETEPSKIKIQLDEIVHHGCIQLMELIEESPEDAFEIVQEAYLEAYYSIKTEKPKTINFEFTHLPDHINKNNFGKPLKLEDIKSDKIGKVVEFEAEIVAATDVKSAMKTGYYICDQCGEILQKDIKNPFEMQLDPICKKCAATMRLEKDKSEYVDFQELEVQQPLATMTDPEGQAKTKRVLVENSKGYSSGSIKITGIPIKMPKNKKIMIEDIYIKAIGIEEIKNAARIEMNEDDENDIKKVVNQLKSENKDVAQFFANQLFSRIMGHDDIKKALLLQQIKGVNKKLGEDSLRANSHILIVSDPGVAKSTMLNTISKIPGNTLTSMTGASAVGLIASVQKSQSLLGDESWRASLGPIPKADGGSCCIDEFAVNPEAQKVLLTPMENEYGPVDKASIHIKLPTRTAILAACNPKFGRFDPDLSIVEQINMKPQMLSRFDMIFVIRDLPDKEKDAKIMRHILEMHANAYNQTVNDNKSVVEVAGVEITQEFIHKYIYYARSQAPRIPHPNEDAETTTKILSIYQTMRFLGSHINPRSGEAFIRVAEQIAKSKLKSGTIEVDDVVEAIGMIQESYKSIAYNAETGSFDMDKVSGISKEDTNLQKDIFKVIKKNGLISEIEIIENFTEKGYPEEKIKAKLKKLISNGDIDEPKTGKFRVI